MAGVRGGGVFLNWNEGQAGERRWFGNDSWEGEGV